MPPVPTITASVVFIGPQAGGRLKPPQSGYRGQFFYNDTDCDAFHIIELDGELQPGQEVIDHISLPNPSHLTRLTVGMMFLIREGAHTVGYGRIVRVHQHRNEVLTGFQCSNCGNSLGSSVAHDQAPKDYRRLSRVLDYYDGPVSGVFTCAQCSTHYAYDMLDWDSEQRYRIFMVRMLTTSDYEKFRDSVSHKERTALNTVPDQIVLWDNSQDLVMANMPASSELENDEWLPWFESPMSIDWFTRLNIVLPVESYH